MGDDDLEDSIMDYADARFEIRPYPKYRNLIQIKDLVNRPALRTYRGIFVGFSCFWPELGLNSNARFTVIIDI